MSEELCHLSLTEAADLIKAKKLSPVELTEAMLRRTDALNSQLDAFITRTSDVALAAARKAESEIAKGGHKGPLHGIPFGLKDIYNTKGILTTAHSRILIDNVPDEDATTTAQLSEAGAVLMGKLSTHEFAHGGPSFDLPWRPARNPWNTEHFTGGSSSGSGAAVASGLMMMAMGSDTGGSIRNPAALCGLVGLKPTYGLVSRHGVIANSYSYDHAGPLTWTVADCAAVMQVLAKHDPKDPASANVKVPDYRAALTGDIRGLRVGVVRHFYEQDVQVSDEVKQGMTAALDVLRGLGAIVEDVRLRPAMDYYDIKIVTAESELYAVHEHNLRTRPGDFGEDFLARSLAACLIRGSDYVQAQRERRKVLEEMKAIYAKYDVLVTPGPGPAPKLGNWRVIQFWQKASLTTPFNVTGGPALVQCMGYTRDGLPLSLQIVGKPFDEATVMRVADAYERATPWRKRRPELVASSAPPPALPPIPEPEKSNLSRQEEDAVALVCRRAGLTLNDRYFQQLCATAPYIEAMTSRLRRQRDWYEEPINVFTF
ncbi:MAG: amidase [Hyphomicrobiaceae bacterium]|nr:amidase [Hyphomicrobiaceae bacterium]